MSLTINVRSRALVAYDKRSLEGAVVTADAAFIYKPIALAIRKGGADYFLFVKGNQPQLRAELERAFGDTSPPSDRHRDAAQDKRAA